MQKHKAIKNYIDHFTHNAKRGIRNVLLRLKDELTTCFEERFLDTIKDYLTSQLDNMASCGSNYAAVPNFRKIQIANEGNPK